MKIATSIIHVKSDFKVKRKQDLIVTIENAEGEKADVQVPLDFNEFKTRAECVAHAAEQAGAFWDLAEDVMPQWEDRTDQQPQYSIKLGSSLLTVRGDTLSGWLWGLETQGGQPIVVDAKLNLDRRDFPHKNRLAKQEALSSCRTYLNQKRVGYQQECKLIEEILTSTR